MMNNSGVVETYLYARTHSRFYCCNKREGIVAPWRPKTVSNHELGAIFTSFCSKRGQQRKVKNVAICFAPPQAWFCSYYFSVHIPRSVTFLTHILSSRKEKYLASAMVTWLRSWGAPIVPATGGAEPGQRPWHRAKRSHHRGSRCPCQAQRELELNLAHRRGWWSAALHATAWRELITLD